MSAQRIYRFYLTVGSTVTEVFPLNFLETSLDDQLEQNNVFYRRKFINALTFVDKEADDFDLLWGIEQIAPCEKLYFLIERDDVYYWDGYFSTNEGAFDLDKCTFTVTPLPNDDYAYILDRAKLQQNILNVTPGVTVLARKGLISIDYTRNRFLNDVIDYLGTDAVVGVMPGATVSSDFFTDATNPVTLTANKLLYLTIAQKSDIIRPDSTEPATTALMSWEEMMKILWGMFQVMWNYDSGTNTINVEHISWFTSGNGLDLRGQRLTRATNKYSYIKEEMPKYEKFSWMEADDTDFVGTPIYYDSACVNQDPNSNVKETGLQVTTDIEYIITNSDAIADEGFVIFCNYLSGASYYIESTEGAYAHGVRLNMRLSWANLHNAYYRHNRVLIEGNMNGMDETFWTAQKVKLQECFAVVCPSDNYDPSDKITTELGETYFAGEKAYVRLSSLKPSGEMKFSLLYGPGDNENTGVDDDLMVVTGYVTFPGKNGYVFRFFLSKPAPADIDIRVRDIVYDSLGAVRCTGAWYTITFTAGDITETDGDSLCAALNAGDCVVMEIEYDDAEIDDMDLDPDADSCDVPFIYTVI